MNATSVWRDREASTNPVYPYEWALAYGDGTRFPRVLDGRARRTAEAPLPGIIQLAVWGPGLGAVILPSWQIVDGIVARARVARAMPDLTHGLIGGWVFGFLRFGLFIGITIDAVGRMTRVDVPTPFRTVWGPA